MLRWMSVWTGWVSWRPCDASPHDIVARTCMERDSMSRETLVEDIQIYAQNIVDTVREPLLILDTTLRVRSANRAFTRRSTSRPRRPRTA